MGKKGKEEEIILQKMKALSLQQQHNPAQEHPPQSQQSQAPPQQTTQSLEIQVPSLSQPIQVNSQSQVFQLPNQSEQIQCQAQKQILQQPAKKHQSGDEIRRVDAWFQFVKNLPNLPPALVSRLKADVFEFLELAKVDMNLIKLYELDKCDFKPVIKLDDLEKETGFGFSNVVAPPVTSCILCHGALHLHNKPTNVVIHGFEGPRVGSKYILRCKRCKSVGDSVNYRPEMFGNDSTGWMFYDEENEFIKATANVYLEVGLVKYILASLHHVWASFEGSAEVYNEVNRESATVEKIKTFFQQNPKGGEENEVDAEAPFLKTRWKAHELSRKNVSRAVWSFLVKQEMSERGMKLVFKGNLEDAFIRFMEEVDELRSKELYFHGYCNEKCLARGCGKVWVFDGLWKLRYPVCMISR